MPPSSAALPPGFSPFVAETPSRTLFAAASPLTLLHDSPAESIGTPVAIGDMPENGRRC